MSKLAGDLLDAYTLSGTLAHVSSAVAFWALQVERQADCSAVDEVEHDDRQV
jgi:hypothetical protein